MMKYNEETGSGNSNYTASLTTQNPVKQSAVNENPHISFPVTPAAVSSCISKQFHGFRRLHSTALRTRD
jgi:hypothetical protein